MSDNKRYSKRVWSDIKLGVSKLDPHNNSKTDFFMVLANTILKNIKYFEKLGLDKDYPLVEYISYDPKKYPVEYSELSLIDLIKWLFTLEEPTLNSITRMATSVLWEMLAYEVRDVSCPCCEDGGLRVLYDTSDSVFVFKCDICSWMQYKNGDKYSHNDRYLKPSKLSLLLDEGLIIKKKMKI